MSLPQSVHRTHTWLRICAGMGYGGGGGWVGLATMFLHTFSSAETSKHSHHRLIRLHDIKIHNISYGISKGDNWNCSITKQCWMEHSNSICAPCGAGIPFQPNSTATANEHLHKEHFALISYADSHTRLHSLFISGCALHTWRVMPCHPIENQLLN